MATMTPTELKYALESFDFEHGGVLASALAVYAEHMRETAAEAEIEAWCPERRPEPPREHPDGTTTISLRPAPRGFARMAEMFEWSAAKADKAQAAYSDLMEAAYEDDDDD